jgi:Family of unknown function (DUF6364)
MKTKLTLTIDEDLIPQAKRHAEARRDSLSSLLEKALQDLTQTKRYLFLSVGGENLRRLVARQLAAKLCPSVICDHAHAHKVTANAGVIE